MADRIVLIGCGGIGSQLLPPLVRYLSNRPEPRPLLVLVDGDVFEPANRSRQACPRRRPGHEQGRGPGPGRSEAVGSASRRSPSSSTTDQRRARRPRGRRRPPRGRQPPDAGARRPAHRRSLADVTLISGGNDETDGNVQLVRRRDGWSRRRPPVEIHPEIGEAADCGGHRRAPAVGPGGRAPAAPRDEPDGRKRDAQLPLAGQSSAAASPTARSTST